VVKDIPIRDIKVVDKRRKLRDLTELKNSINSLGLINPITVTQDNCLVAGYHRLEACKELGWETIPAQIVEADELTAELIEIDENLIRNELTVLERGEVLKRRKEIYEAMYPETKHGGLPGLPGGGKAPKNEMISSFAIDTANKTGYSPRTIQQEVQIVNKLDENVKEKIRDTELANNKTELLKLARLDKEEQNKIVEKIVTGTAKSVSDARKKVVFEEKKAVSINELKDKYSVILCDVPWSYEFSKDNSDSIDYHYPTMTLQEIKDLKIPSADNAVIFFWATAPKLKEALEVLGAWGFEYKTCAVWDKEWIGMGYWFRGQHELLLVGVKGSFSPPPEECRFSSVIREKRREHSRKPDKVYEMIETMFPQEKKLELFARNKRPGWMVWGNEV